MVLLIFLFVFFGVFNEVKYFLMEMIFVVVIYRERDREFFLKSLL